MTKIEEAGIIYGALKANLCNKKEVFKPERYRWKMSEDVAYEIENELGVAADLYLRFTSVKLFGIIVEAEMPGTGVLELWEKIGEVPKNE